MSLRRVPVTRVQAVAAETRGPAPSICLSACTACGHCVVVCPSGAVDLAVHFDGAWGPSIDDGRCTRCFDCVEACPEQAIEVPFEIVEGERIP